MALSVAGLTPGTLYHRRVVAANAGGVTNGLDVPFKTSTLAPFQVTGTPAAQGGGIRLLVASAPGASFTVWSATNVNLPSSNWTLLGPMTETAAGLYQFTDPLSSAEPQRYYRVRSP